MCALISVEIEFAIWVPQIACLITLQQLVRGKGRGFAKVDLCALKERGVIGNVTRTKLLVGVAKRTLGACGDLLLRMRIGSELFLGVFL